LQAGAVADEMAVDLNFLAGVLRVADVAIATGEIVVGRGEAGVEG
jgi:hypothetical protein